MNPVKTSFQSGRIASGSGGGGVKMSCEFMYLLNGESQLVGDTALVHNHEDEYTRSARSIFHVTGIFGVDIFGNCVCILVQYAIDIAADIRTMRIDGGLFSTLQFHTVHDALARIQFTRNDQRSTSRTGKRNAGKAKRANDEAEFHINRC